MVHPVEESCDFRVVGVGKTLLLRVPSHILDLKSWATNSYGKQDRFKPLWWNRQAILFKSCYISLNCLTNICNRFFLSSSLTDAPW